MSQIISCLTKHSKDPIVFKLLGNNFTDRFFKKLKWVKEIYQFESSNDYIPLVVHAWDNKKIKQIESNLQDSVNWLNQHGYNFPLTADEIQLENNSSSRQLLNKLHRYFTTGNRCVNCNEPIKKWLDYSSFVFEHDTSKYSQFTKAVHNINTKVHEAEQFYSTPQMLTFPPQIEYTLTFLSTKPIKPDIDPQQEFLTPITKDDYKYFSDDVAAYDVWLPLGEIQGKNYYRCYFDNDEPNHWDVFTNHYYSGSFTFADRRGMQHPDMIAFLEKYGIKPGPLTIGVPVGNIIKGKELLKYFDVHDIVKVDLVE